MTKEPVGTRALFVASLAIVVCLVSCSWLKILDVQGKWSSVGYSGGWQFDGGYGFDMPYWVAIVVTLLGAIAAGLIILSLLDVISNKPKDHINVSICLFLLVFAFLGGTLFRWLSLTHSSERAVESATGMNWLGSAIELSPSIIGLVSIATMGLGAFLAVIILIVAVTNKKRVKS